MEPLAMSVPNVAQLLGVRESVVRTWIAKRRIASVRLGRSVVIPTRELDSLKTLAAQERSGWLYVIRATNGLYKIGRTRNDPRQRLATIKTGSPLRVSLVRAVEVEDCVGAERALHAELVGQRVRGEWFRLDRSALRAVLAQMEAWNEW